MSLTLLGLFLLMSAFGVPLAVALGLASLASIALYTSMPMDLLAQTMFSGMNSFLLVAVPLFILVGVLMERGRVAERLFDFAEAIVGWLPGGLGHVNVASSVIFGGVSGSSVADIASIGAIEIKAMERHGFPKGYAVGLTLCTSTLSSIIPPSILIVIAGSVANASIGTLLVAGLVPGLFLAFVFMVFNHIYAVRNGFNPPTPFNVRRVVTTGLAATRSTPVRPSTCSASSWKPRAHRARSSSSRRQRNWRPGSSPLTACRPRWRFSSAISAPARPWRWC